MTGRAPQAPRAPARPSARARSGAALGTALRRAVYLATAALWLTGAGWLWLKRFGQVQGPFGPQPRPLQAALLKAHGAAAMAFLLVLGALLAQHVPAGWKMRRQRVNGAGLLAVNGVLVITGWCLYYLGGDSSRAAASTVHWTLGLALPALVFFHVWNSRRAAS